MEDIEKRLEDEKSHVITKLNLMESTILKQKDPLIGNLSIIKNKIDKEFPKLEEDLQKQTSEIQIKLEDIENQIT